MKINKQAFIAFLALAGVAFVGRPARAATVSYNDGDIFIGFRATDVTQDYLVDLGQPAQFTNAAPGATISLGNFGTDLSTIFGSDWYTRINPSTAKNAVLFALVGGNVAGIAGDPVDTLYTSRDAAVRGTAWLRQPDSQQSGTTSSTDSLGSNYSGSTSTANNATGVQQANSANSSYASYQPGGANSSGISFATWNPTDEGAPATKLFLDRLTPTNGGTAAGQTLGSVTLASNGAATFTASASAIPEPSTYALAGVGAMLLVIFVRRQRRVLAA